MKRPIRHEATCTRCHLPCEEVHGYQRATWSPGMYDRAGSLEPGFDWTESDCCAAEISYPEVTMDFESIICDLRNQAQSLEMTASTLRHRVKNDLDAKEQAERVDFKVAALVAYLDKVWAVHTERDVDEAQQLSVPARDDVG